MAVVEGLVSIEFQTIFINNNQLVISPLINTS